MLIACWLESRHFLFNMFISPFLSNILFCWTYHHKKKTWKKNLDIHATYSNIRNIHFTNDRPPGTMMAQCDASRVCSERNRWNRSAAKWYRGGRSKKWLVDTVGLEYANVTYCIIGLSAIIMGFVPMNIMGLSILLV